MTNQDHDAVPVLNDSTCRIQGPKVEFYVQKANRGKSYTGPLLVREEVMAMALLYRNVTVRRGEIRCQRWRTRKKGELVRHNPQLLPHPVTCVGAAGHG